MTTGGWVGPFSAFLSSVTWAIGSAVYSRHSRLRSAFSINFTRATIALPMFVVASFIAAGGWSQGLAAFAGLGSRHFGWFGLSMIASYAVGDVLFLLSTRSLGVPGALAIASSYPLWTALAGRDPLAGLQWLGLLLALVGIAVVIVYAPKTSAKAQARPTGRKRIGVLLALGTSFFWALNSFSVSRGGEGVLAPVGNCVRMVWALLLTFLLSRFWRRPGETLLIPRKVLGRDLWVFAFESFGGSYVFVYGLAHSPLVIGAILSSLAPVLAVPVAWSLRLEKISPLRTLGVILVVVGLSLLI